MDIKSLIDDLRGMKQIQFNFHKSSEYEVEVKIEDSKYSLSRAFRNNKFASTGSRLILEASEKGIRRYERTMYILSNYACCVTEFYLPHTYLTFLGDLIDFGILIFVNLNSVNGKINSYKFKGLISLTRTRPRSVDKVKPRA